MDMRWRSFVLQIMTGSGVARGTDWGSHSLTSHTTSNSRRPASSRDILFDVSGWKSISQLGSEALPRSMISGFPLKVRG